MYKRQDVIKVPLVENNLNIDALAEQVGTAKIIFLCSPGNPTGNVLPSEQIKAILALFKDEAIVVVDEAYIEFCPDTSVSSWLNEYDNLVVLRTLSKAFALAGLRCGFTLASPSIIEMMSKVIAPYPISTPVADIATKALNADGLKVMIDRVKSTNFLKEALIEWLKTKTWCVDVFESDANFVLFRTDKKQPIFDLLLENNILIRDQSKQVQLENCLRISIGNSDEIEQLKSLLDSI